MTTRIPLALVTALALGSCCHCLKPTPPDTRPLPPPITMQQQLDDLNRRATELPRLIAHTHNDGIEIWYTQDGKQKHKSADGYLELRQDYATHSAQVYVKAEVLSQVAFEAGKNDKEWWYVSRGGNGEKPSGAFGNATGQPQLSEKSGAILRPDLIPPILAITEIEPTDQHTIVMRVDDLRGVNDLLLMRPTADGAAHISREILVDRRSGEVREVGLFNPEGLLIVHATLDNYAPATYTGNAAPLDGQIPSMPHRIHIDYIAQHATVELRIADWQVPPKIRGTPFDTPDWSDYGVTPTFVEP